MFAKIVQSRRSTKFLKVFLCRKIKLSNAFFLQNKGFFFTEEQIKGNKITFSQANYLKKQIK